MVQTEVGLPFGGLFDEDWLFFDIGDGDTQVRGQGFLFQSGFGRVALLPLLEGEVLEVTAFHDRGNLAPDDLHPQREGIHLFLVPQGEVVDIAFTRRGQVGNIFHHDGAVSVGGNREYPRLEIVALDPFNQTGVHTFPDFLFEHLPALVFLHRDPIYKNSVDIKPVAADGRAFGKGEIQIPG